MTGQVKDSTSRSPLLAGRELEEGTILQTLFALKDAIKLTELEGPHLTRRGIINNRIVQSWLDKIYISNNGNWICDRVI
jgi:hypothetical protein